MQFQKIARHDFCSVDLNSLHLPPDFFAVSADFVDYWNYFNSDGESPAPNKLLLVGSAKSGKTSIVSALASRSRCENVYLCDYGQQPGYRHLSSVINAARLQTPCVVILEYVDLLVPINVTSNQVDTLEVVSSIRNLPSDCLLLCTTAIEANQLHPLLRNAFDLVLKIQHPNKQAISKYIDKHVQERLPGHVVPKHWYDMTTHYEVLCAVKGVEIANRLKKIRGENG